ncbi:preprotein translocase subunit SecE [Mycolicibacterium elephantis]|uniref:Protein translocase subunit SecE n=1 Tax=Mycolicibacterium elephantis TaxID=81858 RepID=A0A1X0D8Q3_9MYCO|nr:preprotein translocase subunit SecE [Mycolicibacterium elephantis]ORA68773.1 preprotein translocase subunit SecE [Mycolicibacterium elephantis]
MSDSEPERPDSTGAGSNPEPGGGRSSDGRTAVATPARPTGKRSRRGAAAEGESDAVDLATGTEAAPTKNGSGKKKKTAKKRGDGPSRNPLVFVWTYLQQVVAELRKVIWPNRKQMVSYTTVVLVFLAFMVAMIFAADYGLNKLVNLVFG